MFIGRRADGSIYGTWTVGQPQDADHPNIEEVPDDHPEVVAFMTRSLPDRRAELASALDSATTIAQLRAAVKEALGLS